MKVGIAVAACMLCAGCVTTPTQPTVNLNNTVWKTITFPNGNAPMPPKLPLVESAARMGTSESSGAADADVVTPPSSTPPVTNLVLSWNAAGQQEYFIYYTTNLAWCVGTPKVNGVPTATIFPFVSWKYLASYYAASNRLAQVNIPIAPTNPAAYFKVQ